MSKSPTGGIIWARVGEAHQDGRLHFHAVFFSPSKDVSIGLINAAASWWSGRYGLARCEPVGSVKAVLEYMVKHVSHADLAEMDFSHNFGWQA